MLEKITQFIYKNQKVITVVTVVLSVLLLVNVAHAGIVDDFKNVIIIMIVTLIQSVQNMLGSIMIFVITLLVDVATYDRYATSKAVSSGWKVVRDISNIMIVLSLLYIAFRSVTGNSAYAISTNLKNLVVVAILINFSKTITLIAIDISQVIMLTFVNSFADIGAGNFNKILNIDKITQASANPNASTIGSLAGLLLGVVLMVIIIFVLGILLATLLMRVVAFWFLLVLSPIALAVWAIPIQKLKSINTKWTEELTNWLLIGPLLAFFIWLTFTSIGGEELVTQDKVNKAPNIEGISAAAEYDSLIGFVLAISMLIMGLKFSSQISGGAGKMAGSLAGKIESTGFKIRDKGLRLAKATTLGAVPFAAKLGRDVAIGLARRTGNKAEKLKESDSKVNKIVGYALGSIGGVVRAGKHVKEFVQKSNPKRTSSALYRRLVLAEKGAVGSALTENQEELVNTKVEEIKKSGRGVNESKIIKDAIKSGERSDMTLTELMAEMKVALNNGAIKSDSEYLDWEQMLKEKAKNSPSPVASTEYIEEQSGNMRKDFFDKNSIFKHSEINEEDAQKKIEEQYRSLDERDVFKKSNVYELDTTNDMYEKDGIMQFKNDSSENNFNRRKTAALAYSESSIAQNNSVESKSALRDHLLNLIESDQLNKVEKEKAQRLISATYMNAKEAKNDNNLELTIKNNASSSFEKAKKDRDQKFSNESEKEYTPQVRSNLKTNIDIAMYNLKGEGASEGLSEEELFKKALQEALDSDPKVKSNKKIQYAAKKEANQLKIEYNTEVILTNEMQNADGAKNVDEVKQTIQTVIKNLELSKGNENFDQGIIEVKIEQLKKLYNSINENSPIQEAKNQTKEVLSAKVTPTQKIEYNIEVILTNEMQNVDGAKNVDEVKQTIQTVIKNLELSKGNENFDQGIIEVKIEQLKKLYNSINENSPIQEAKNQTKEVLSAKVTPTQKNDKLNDI